jgi:hypothetical protein
MIALTRKIAERVEQLATQSTFRRRLGRPCLACESLEGRQLLNASWGNSAPSGGLRAAGLTPAEIQALHGGAGPRHAIKFDALGKGGHAPSAQAQADMKTLETDMIKLISEVPASLTTELKADQQVVEKALRSLAPTNGQFDMASPTLKNNAPAANLSTMLTKAGVPSSQITTIVNDFQTFQNTLETVDPTLWTKVQADQTAVANDLPAGAHVPDRGAIGMIGPGM